MKVERNIRHATVVISGVVLLFLAVSCQNNGARNTVEPDIPKSLSDIKENKLFRLTNNTPWRQVAAVPLKFNAFHTQGMVKVGEYFYMSAVEVNRWPKAFEQKQGKLDRDAGEGRGHIFKFDKDGKLLKDVLIGKGDAYHPGGLDYDGKYIWIPVTEYRPNSFSIIYKLDPETMEITEAMRYDDSIGAMIHDTDGQALVGVNWDARVFYRWTFDDKRRITTAGVAPEFLGVTRDSYYIAYQDCQYLGDRLMLCSGHQSYKNETGTFRLGGWEIIDLRDFRPVLQVPINLWSPSGAAMTNNPCTVEITDGGIRAYFVPDDDEKAVLFIYETDI